MPNTALSLVVTKEMLDKLQKADDKLKQLAKTSDAASKKIIASFKSINTQGIGAFINKLDEAQRKLSQLGSTRLNLGGASNIQAMTDAINRLSQASRTSITINGIDTVGNQATKAMDAINRLIATLGQLQNAGGMQSFNQVNVIGRETLKEMNREAKKMERTLDSLDKSIAKYGISATELANKLAQARQAQEQFNESAKRQAQSDVNGLLGMRGQQKTLNELKNYANELKRTMANLDPQSKEWQQLNKVLNETNKKINDIQGAMKGVKNRSHSLMQTMNQFRQLVGVVFSISRITNFANKLMNVRKEFEMQQRSLQALLQNKDEADKLWQKTIDLAIKSPFRVKELVTYTKQLAAYRIESDKLYETNKMLADISAGLGVDMQRLILAYGQVKAANYLRGTELRQFSEAGVNILGELSNYFTELEGRAISVGDVFERVSKRMVSFSDVEEIFKRLTSAGGTFYRMQEIQSETLKGLLSNLGDSIDIMLNDIGREHDSTLKGAVESVRNLVENWRDFAYTLKTILSLLSPYLAITTLIKVANSGFANSLVNIILYSEKAGTKLVNLNGSITNFAKTLGLTAKHAQKFTQVLGGLATLGVAGIIAGIVVGIAALIAHLTRASREAKRLQKELNAIYNEDTTNLDLQIKGYENLISRLKDVVKGSKEHDEIIKKLNSQYGEQIGFLVTETTTYEQLKNAIDSVNLSLTRRAKLNTYEKSIAKVYESTNKALLDSEKQISKELGNILASVDGKDRLSYSLDDTEISKVLDEVDDKIKELGRSLTYSELITTINDALEKQLVFNGSANALLGVIENRSKVILQRKEKELEIEKAINNLYKDNANSASEAQKAFAQLEKEQDKALKNAIKKPKWEQEEIKRQFAEQKIDLQVKYEGLDEGVAKMRKEALNRISATINDINKKIEGNVKTLGEKFANLIYITPTEAETGISQIAESTAGAYKAQKEIIKQQNALKDAGTVYDKDILENAKKTAAAYYYKLQLMGRLDLLEKEQNKEEKKELQLLNKQISALKEARQTFDSLREKFWIDEATNRTAKAFEDLFKELDMQDLTLGMSFDISGVMKVLKQLPNLAGEAGRIAIEKFNAELQGGLDVDAQVLADTKLLREIENMFTGYEVSLELQKLNIPKDWARDFFGIETFDLSDIRTKIESELQKKIGEDRRKELEKDLEKVKEMEVKAQQERLKTYLQYARDAVGERAKIKLEEMRKLQEIEKTFTEPEQEEVKQKAIAKVKKDSEQAQQRLDWEEFQKSDTFINLFNDLDNASSMLINHALSKLKEFKDEWKDMPLEDMRSIIGKISELEENLVNISPIKAIKSFRDEINQIIKDTTFASDIGASFAIDKKYVSAFEAERVYWENLINSQKSELGIVEAILNAKEEGKEIDVEALNLSEYEQSLTELTKEELRDIVKELKEMLGISTKNVGKTNRVLNLYNQESKAISKVVSYIKEAFEKAKDLSSAFENLNEVLGKDSNGIVGAIANSGLEMMNLVIETITLIEQLKKAELAAMTFGTAMKLAMGIIGWIMIAVEAIAKILGSIFAAHDKRLENQIESLKEKVDELNKKLEVLEEMLDKAFNIRQLEQYTKEVQRNVNAQIQAYEKMIKLEEEKKKTDDEKIKEYKGSIEELKETQKELMEDSISTATSGILDSVKDAARDFVDAWYEAFAETGNGLQGLRNNFQEIMLDMVQQQATLGIAGNFLDRWKRELNKYINKDDLELTTKEAKTWVDTVQKELPQLNEALEAYFKAMEQAGVNLGETSDELSGLQRGIQGLSESTGQELAAYLNSIRFFVADTNTKLSQFVDAFFNTEGVNPMLSQLRIIAEQTTAIHTLLNSLTTPHPTLSGRGLKVVL